MVLCYCMHMPVAEEIINPCLDTIYLSSSKHNNYSSGSKAICSLGNYLNMFTIRFCSITSLLFAESK